MCNFYSHTKSQDAMRHVFDDLLIGDETFEDLTGIYPDDTAPVIRHGPKDSWQMAIARWGMPTSATFLEGKRSDPGVTIIHNTASPNWRRWLGGENCCLVPFFSFSEIDTRAGSPRNHPIWFVLGPDCPLAFFSGLHTEWTSVCKLKEGEVTADLFGFLTCALNADVAPPPPTAEALHLQRPLPDGILRIVAEGGRADAL
ncbi:SOS response-associated peptidase family protein [Yoonia sp. MH D7]